MVQNDYKNLMALDLSRENIKQLTIKNMTAAGVLSRDEAARYDKVLDSLNDFQMMRLWLLSQMYKEETGEIIR